MTQATPFTIRQAAPEQRQERAKRPDDHRITLLFAQPSPIASISPVLALRWAA